MQTSPDHIVRTGGGTAGPAPASASATQPVPPASWWLGSRRRPTGEPPPLPRHLESTGVGWLVAAVVLVVVSLLVFAAGRYGHGISLTAVDIWVLARLAGWRSPGLTSVLEAMSELLGSLGMVKVVGAAALLVLVACRRFRHLLVGLASLEVVTLLLLGLSILVRRPRPFGVLIEGDWTGWSMPSRPVAYLAALLVALLYSLVPKGRWRQTGKWAATGLVTLLGLARLYLGLPEHGMRLQVPLLVGPVVDPLVPTKEPQEPTTVTPAEIIYHRRVQVLDRAGQTSVTEACRTFGISRTTYYRWAGRAQRYGLAALLPKGRRPPVLPTATPPDQVEAVLAEAVARPTLGARQLVGHLAERGVRLSASGVQKLLRRHRLGRRAQRLAALAQLTAATTGILTSPAKEGPFGFCHFAARPGDLVALDTFYVGKLKGIGPVWQLTAVDTATRYAIGALVAGDKSARDAAAFVDHVAERLDGIGVELTGVLTDNGPEFIGKAFTSHLADRSIRHRRIPPRSPNHNAVCERFQGTALQEFYRPAFHRQHFARLADLGAQFQGWLQHYNTRRRNHGDFMRGRTPFAVMEAHLS